MQGNAPCDPSIFEFISGRVISETELVLQLSSSTDWAFYTAPLGSYVWDSCPYLRDVTGKVVDYTRHTGSTLRQMFHTPRSVATKELSVIPVFVRPPGCWSDDHKVTLEWLGTASSFLALPAPVPVLTLPAPARVLALPAPAPVLTLPAPAPVLTLPAPARLLTLPAPARILTLPAPARILTLPAPAPVLTLPAPPPSLDASHLNDDSLVYFLGFAWRNVFLGGRKFGWTLVLNMLLVLQLVGQLRYRVVGDYSVTEDASSKSGSRYTDPFDGLTLNSTWTSTHCHLGGLAPDLFRLADQLLAVKPTTSLPLAEFEEDPNATEEYEDSEAGLVLEYLDPFDGLDLDALWIPTRAHLGGLAPDLFQQVDKLFAEELTTSSLDIVDDVDEQEEGAAAPEAMITGDEEPGTPEVEDPPRDNEVDAVELGTPQAQEKATMDVQAEDHQEVVESRDGNTDPLDHPFGNWSDEPPTPDVQHSSPALEQSEVLLANDAMDSPEAAAVVIDKRQTRSGRRANAWRNRGSTAETPVSRPVDREVVVEPKARETARAGIEGTTRGKSSRVLEGTMGGGREGMAKGAKGVMLDGTEVEVEEL
ncbi:hypothetical protein FRC07_004592 [Ceratobasidium sp. 392]|nr:hypothetical protein FRC07_004592 [Ceratobasidium sp. 392]